MLKIAKQSHEINVVNTKKNPSKQMLKRAKQSLEADVKNTKTIS